MFHFLTAKKVCRHSLLPLLFLLLGEAVSAQLKADFTIDKAGGCSPLTVSFTNITTGASPAAVYKWDFGNGNVSAIFSPGATYVTEKTYTVTLTVTDGANSAVQTKQLTVYKKPTVDFSASPVKGCLPLPVNFTSSSTAGDGTIASYYWDFGDGNTQQGTDLQVSHTYQFAQTSTVQLTVTNSEGCYNSVSKSIVQVLPVIHATFKTDSIVCNLTDAANFTNTSSGPGNLSYAWDFGDGNASISASPSHLYQVKGTYTVTLQVKNEDGCKASAQTIINVANIVTNFDIPTPVCINTIIPFSDGSSKTPSATLWTFDGNPYTYSYPGGIAYNSFSSSGNHTVTLTNTYGTCQQTVTKQVNVKDVPPLKGFVASLGGACGSPVTVNFSDTTKGDVQWLWSLANGTSSNIQNPSATYTYDDNFQVGLLATNADGCSTNFVQTVSVAKPNIFVTVLSTVGGNSQTVGCEGLTITFAVSYPAMVTSYQWNFGDGSAISTVAQPVHAYTVPGNYTVTLNYTTSSGCTGTATYPYVTVYGRPVVDFTSLSGTSICGNTPVTFSPIFNGGSTQYWTWYFGDGQQGSDPYHNTFTHKYDSAGTFTVMLIAYNYGCADTVVKKDYLKVSPPFPHISAAINTCDGTRGLVTFAQNSKQALSWKWDFGDGSVLSLNANQDTVRHTYTTTGAYNAVLTTVNGQCTVKDSIEVYVLLKQHPLLTGNKTVVCENDDLGLTITKLDLEPQDSINHFDIYDYSVSQFQYGDGTTAISYYGGTYTSGNFSGISLSGLQPGKDSLRVITYSTMHGCYDTSNYVPVRIDGPIAGFKIPNQTPCINDPGIIIDTSKGTRGVPIKKWTWNFGDATSETDTVGGTVKHFYASPATYFGIWLSVTDADGCVSNVYPDYNRYIQINGPKAAFTYSPAVVSPNTAVTFTNTTDVTNSPNTQYQWLFGDGSVSSEYAPTHIYTGEQTDTVKLIAKNPFAGCSDTAVQIIRVKKLHASFTYSSTYVNNNSCPPVIVHFTNTSLNTTSVSWNFGDGNSADNQNNPSHTYNTPGVYQITLYSYGSNNQVDSTADSVTIKGPYAILNADRFSGCLAQTITLSAQVKNASSFTWDFADGTLQQTTDTFAVHAYLTPGLYTPSLILKDTGGCSAVSSLGDTIVVDTLHIGIIKSAGIICDSAVVSFTPGVYSLSTSQMNKPLFYKWNFGTGNPADTSNAGSPVFDYNKPGKYTVTLQVRSVYGCSKQVTDTVLVIKKSKAAITAATQSCAGGSVQFAGTATNPSAAISWNWDFKNGNQSGLQNPPAVLFADAGSYLIQLAVGNNGCSDTVYSSLTVNPKPVINLAPKQSVVCLGKSVQLNAGGGNNYVWSPATGLDNNLSATPFATPLVTTIYSVQVTNSFGCINTDSSIVTVAGPFSLKIPADTFVCKGSAVQLNVSGASNYAWINTTIGLTNSQIANPIAAPQSATTYTVVGYDAYGCFADTASVLVNVETLPTVNAGPDVETLTGSTVQLQATGSADVTQWSWQPPDYLSCADCPAPVSAPRSQVDYVVTGKNKYGCAASDTVIIKLVCAEDRVYIPNAFTPNNDGNNDVFYIKGKGIKIIKSLRIFSRWGEIVFERSNINIDDRSAGWDGNYKGSPVPTGTYVYIAELQCDTGEVFPMKGTLIIIR